MAERPPVQPNVKMDIPFNAAHPAGSKIRARLKPAFVTAFTIGGLLLGCPAAEEITKQKEEPPTERPPDKRERQVAEPEAKTSQNPATDGAGPATPSDPLLVPDLLDLPPPVDGPPGTSRRRNRGAAEGIDRDDAEIDDGPAEPGETKPYTYVIPGFYGTAPTRLTAGEGPLGGPRFRATASVGLGYDDNIQSQSTGSSREKEASPFTNLGLSASYHVTKRLQVLVISGSATGDVFWGADVDPNYSLSLDATYQRIFVGPYTLTANVGLSYQNQADYGTVNTVREVREIDEDGQADDEAASGYLSGSAKLDFTYRWSPQFSTATSLAIDARLYSDARSDDNAVHVTIGNQFRYLVDRYAWIGEVRYESISGGGEDGENTSLQGGGQGSSDSIYVLGGVEWHLGPWIQTSARFGATFRKYEQGDDATSPFGEFAVNFKPSVQNAFGLTAHYGLETSPAGGGDSKTFRVGLFYTRVFNPRLSGTITASYVQSDETEESRQGGFTAGGEGDGERIIDLTAGLNYRLSSKLSLSASLTCTRGTSSGQTGTAGNDPDRNRFVVNAAYEF